VTDLPLPPEIREKFASGELSTAGALREKPPPEPEVPQTPGYGFVCSECKALGVEITVEFEKLRGPHDPRCSHYTGPPVFPDVGRLPLPDPGADEVGRFHSDPHPVEIPAALRVFPRTGSQRRLILDAVAAAGEHGITHDELAAIPEVSDRAHRTRRKELEMAGWVEDSGRTRLTVTGTDAVVWVLTEQGRKEYRGAA
jgi:hypothetical protein